MTGRVFDIQRFSIGNGPGIRTTVFLKGCSLHCLWCHNPESVRPEAQLTVDLRLCRLCGACVEACGRGVHELQGSKHLLHMERCDLCAGEADVDMDISVPSDGDSGRRQEQRICACVDACCYGCISIYGKEYTPEEIAKILQADDVYYRQSGGGITFSGGEPMLQWPFIREVRERVGDISLYIDTCGNCGEEDFADMLQAADGVLFDIKHIDPERHRSLTGQTNERILQNFTAAAASQTALTVRYPMIPDENDDEDTIRGICGLLLEHGIRRLDISPYHDFGENKYYNTGSAPVHFRKHTEEEIAGKQAVFRANGIETTIV